MEHNQLFMLIFIIVETKEKYWKMSEAIEGTLVGLFFDFLMIMFRFKCSLRFNENVLVVNMMKWHLLLDNYVQQMVTFFFEMKICDFI